MRGTVAKRLRRQVRAEGLAGGKARRRYLDLKVAYKVARR